MSASARTADIVRRDRQARKARFPNRPSCRTRRKLAISALQAERLCRVICPSGSLLTPVSSPLCKNILLRHLVETDLLIPPSRPTRGAYRDRHGRRARDAMDAAAFCARGDRRAGSFESVSDQQHADERRLLRTAKSCGPDAPTLASSLRRHFGPTGLRQPTSADDGGKRARSPGRARRKPLKPLRAGMPGDPGATVVTTLVCYQHTAHEAAGATGTRHSPRPLRGER